MFGINWWFVENWREWILVSTKTYYYCCCWRLIPPMNWIKTKQIYFHELIWVLCMDSAVWIQWYLFHFLTANLKQVLIFAYLKQYDRLKIVYDDWLPEIDESKFSCCCLDWLLSRCRRIIEFWYAHLFCGCWWCWLKKTKRSHMCVILYYLSTEHQFCVTLKGQTTVEILTFCSGIVALRTAAEMVEDQDTSWACLGLLLMVHVMYFVLTTGFCSQHIQTRKAFWRTSIALTLTTQQENELLLVFWIA